MLRQAIFDAVEVRALIALILLLAIVVSVFMGKLDAQQLVGVFGTVVGFYFGTKINDTNNT